MLTKVILADNFVVDSIIIIPILQMQMKDREI